jgi:sigma-E factor negative regulatory protein RseA
MNTNKMTQEQISAFADGELADSHIDMALAALRQPCGKAAWDAYHRIGDALRSDELATELSDGFAARMAARLDAEPTIVAPAATGQFGISAPPVHDAAANDAVAGRGLKRFALPGLVAVAAAALAAISAPQLMVAAKSDAEPAGVRVASASASGNARVSHASIMAVAAPPSPNPAAGNPKDAVVLRDPNIDEYLMAHQRFSPSVYSTAQFARSSLFANDSDK